MAKAASLAPGAPVTSIWCEVRESSIHGRGLYATRRIPDDTRILPYVGEKIDKDESDRRGWERMERSQVTGEASVYIFTLNDDFDIDGSCEENIARLINHSCRPNCAAYVDEDENEIWIWATRTIAKGEELLFNYGFDLENFEDHPCHCGASNCVGYIAGEEYWPELKRILRARKKKARAKKSPSTRRKAKA